MNRIIRRLSQPLDFAHECEKGNGCLGMGNFDYLLQQIVSGVLPSA